MAKRGKSVSFVTLVIALLAVAIPATVYLTKQRQEVRQQAAPATVLTFSPSAITKRPGETFAVDVMVDTGSNTISAAKILVDFDTTKLDATAIVPSDFLPVILSSGRTTNSTASITLGSSPTEPKKGTGRLAEITFKAKGPTGSTQITFDNATEVAGISEQTNVLSGKGAAQVTITTSLTQAPHVTPTPTPRGRSLASHPSPTPNLSPTQGASSQQSGFGALTGGNSGNAPGPVISQGTPNLPLPEITPLPLPPEQIKDPLVIAYIKAIFQFIKSIFGR